MAILRTKAKVKSASHYRTLEGNLDVFSGQNLTAMGDPLRFFFVEFDIPCGLRIRSWASSAVPVQADVERRVGLA